MILKTVLKTTLQWSFESLWSVGFRLLGWLLRPNPEVWSSPGGQRVLVIATHPDDEVASCGGAILEHLRRGDPVRICIATDGRQSRALGLEPDAMAAVRRGEAADAVARLGASLDWIGLPEGEWRREDLERRFSEVLADFEPHLVYAPSRIDFHPEHVAVARALAGSLADRGDAGGLAPGVADAVRVYPSQVPLTPLLANLVLPIHPARPQLLAALAAYRSQFGSLERFLRHRRYVGRFYGLAGAEELWCLTPAQFIQLHDDSPVGASPIGASSNGASSQRPPASLFRGLRYYAWSDPLAYLRGLGERRRLVRQAMS